ncbi:MAG TPA: DNA translocase FtsK [Candidatus Omnitrophota bacterium]|nr:DNA translocase FtsK [Candidatus Omnitrophota bacterium]
MTPKDKTRKTNEIWGLLFFLAGIFVLTALAFYQPVDHSYFTSAPRRPVANPTGVIGVYIAHFSFLLFGTSSYAIAGFLVLWAVSFFLQRVPKRKAVKLGGFVFFLASLASLFAWAAPSAGKFQQGGFLGYFLDRQLELYFGSVGALIFLIAFFFLSILLATEYLLFPMISSLISGMVFAALQIWTLFRVSAGLLGAVAKGLAEGIVWMIGRLRASREEGSETRTGAKEKKTKPGRAEEAGEKKGKIKEEKTREDQPEPPEIKVKKYEPTPVAEAPKEIKKTPRAPKPEPPKKEETISVAATSRDESLAEYVFPGTDLLHVPDRSGKSSDEDLKEKAKVLEDTLRDFEIEARVVEIEQGPVITRYELMPAPGVKISSISSLSDDFALALKSSSIRIIAPIPGKGTIGIEVPNSVTDKVYLRELLDSGGLIDFKGKLPLALGKNTSGAPLLADLAEMPHLLIAGSTGSGKTVCVNGIIAGLLYRMRPDELKFVMVDPKMVELAVYNDLPHMLAPVVTDVRKAAATLNWVVGEMENRYKILARCGKRNIQAFNQRDPAEDSDKEIPAKLPYILVVIDELADLMVVARDKVETAIMRLAALSRAVGIHLVFATQRPSVDVITGVIKANFPARIAFKVASKVDSRTVLDMNGAEKLLGKGDMLFLMPGEAKPIRGQGAFVTDKEIAGIVKHASSQREPEYLQELDKIQHPSQDLPAGEKDELYEAALKLVLETRQASTSFLQRRLQVGYGRAARLLDVMEQEGFIGPPQGTKPRQILVDELANEP